MLDIENFDQKFQEIIKTSEWKNLQEAYNTSKTIFMLGHGGNMAIADHAAVDASRLTNKNVMCPGSAITATSLISDTSFENWMQEWLDQRQRGLETSSCLVVGFSCSTSGTSSKTLVNTLVHAVNLGMKAALICSQPKEEEIPGVITIVQNATYYHTSEILSLALSYELIHSAGFRCPSIAQKARDRKFDSLGIKSEVSSENVPPGLESQLKNIAIDFDGVIHTFDRGFYDGTCYGKPIAGSLEAIKELSKDWNVIIYSSKVLPDRPLVNGMTGKELVTEWLKKHNVLQYVSEITHEKVRAQVYIDDKAYRFQNWKDTLAFVEERIK